MSYSHKSYPHKSYSWHKSLPRHSPFYFTARDQSRRASGPIRSASEDLEAQHIEDLKAHDLLPAEFRKLKQDLELYNNIGHMVTFDRIIKDWVVWTRYLSLASSCSCSLHTSLIGLVVLSKQNPESSRQLLQVVFRTFLASFYHSAHMPTINCAL